MANFNIDDIEFKNQNGINKADIIKKYQEHKNDTGSTSIQIALQALHIKYLNDEHFKYHKGDNHSRQGLIKSVSNVKKLLKYLYRTNYNQYIKITEDLQIHKWYKAN